MLILQNFHQYFNHKSLPDFWLICLSGIILFTGCSQDEQLPTKTIPLRKPFAQWTLKYSGYSGNPYDVEASAIFQHQGSDIQKKSLMFYAGHDSLWKFRFTGIKAGKWTIKTKGPGKLGGLAGTVEVTEADGVSRPGFFAGQGKAWVWQGTDKAFVPQLVMVGSPAQYWKGGAVDTTKINKTIQQFIVETGFTGFHLWGAGLWFNLKNKSTRAQDGKPIGYKNPDQKSFQFYETFLKRSYKAGAATHFWMWGSDAPWARSGPAGIGGHMSKTDKRLLRYIAARLGPIPGWSMGYGFDLQPSWVSAKQLQLWHDYFKKLLGGWQHMLGGRSDHMDANNQEMKIWMKPGHKLHREPLSGVYWTGDYRGHYDYRVAYPWYVKVLSTFMNPPKPQMQEDRFRIRKSSTFQPKDYTPGMTVRGLWHSTMAGGVGNIWGNLLHSDNGNLRGSSPYDNKAEATIRGTKVKVNIKKEIKTYSIFWFKKDRFSANLVRDNALTGNKTGTGVLSAQDTAPISVCLRNKNYNRYIFYTETTKSVKMDLSKSQNLLPAIVVDTRRPYKEIKIGPLNPKSFTWKAAYQSNWAIAVGEF